MVEIGGGPRYRDTVVATVVPLVVLAELGRNISRMEGGVVTKARSRRHSRIRYAYFYVDRRFFFLLPLSLSLSLSVMRGFPFSSFSPPTAYKPALFHKYPFPTLAQRLSLFHLRPSLSLTLSLSLSSSPTSLVRPNRHAPHHDRHPAFLSLSLSPVPDKLLACPSPSSLRLQLPRRLAPRDFLRSPISLHDRSSHASLFRATLYFPSSRRSLVPIRVVAA